MKLLLWLVLFCVLLGISLGAFGYGWYHIVTWVERGRPVAVKDGKVLVRPTGFLAQISDYWMAIPESFVHFGEVGVHTHPWNRVDLSQEQVAHLKSDLMIRAQGIAGEMTRYPLTLMPLFGGWRKYVVFAPTNRGVPWYPLWKSPKGSNETFASMSRIPCWGPCRLKVGPGDVEFAAISLIDGSQLAVEEIAQGIIGDGGLYSTAPMR